MRRWTSGRDIVRALIDRQDIGAPIDFSKPARIRLAACEKLPMEISRRGAGGTWCAERTERDAGR
jgi:hypothetical protein